jgi:UDP-glucose 6-dehydrogenase
VKIAVVGLWHLGTVTAACLAAAGHDVIEIDDAAIAEDILIRRLPVDEPRPPTTIWKYSMVVERIYAAEGRS